MSNAEERALEKYPANKTVFDKYEKQRYAFICGYMQAEKDLLENEHEKSWRLDKKLWKGIKGIERASYQYMYDASNDWAYDIPTWEDVQDAFKAGSEWKEDLALTWEDIRDICRMWIESKTPFGVTGEALSIEVLNRFNKQKGK